MQFNQGKIQRNFPGVQGTQFYYHLAMHRYCCNTFQLVMDGNLKKCHSQGMPNWFTMFTHSVVDVIFITAWLGGLYSKFSESQGRAAQASKLIYKNNSMLLITTENGMGERVGSF
jgi:hypothetical protein